MNVSVTRELLCLLIRERNKWVFEYALLDFQILSLVEMRQSRLNDLKTSKQNWKQILDTGLLPPHSGKSQKRDRRNIG